MNREDIIRMAREAGFESNSLGITYTSGRLSELLEHFAALVASAERNRTWTQTHWTEYEHAIVAKERENTNNAYKERNQLVALLSTVFPSGKAKTAIDGWDEAWHGCVYIDFPWGQASWHYHTDDGWMFEHLPPYKKQWDGHTTEAKYAAIANAIRARGQA